MNDQSTSRALTIAQELGGKRQQFVAALPPQINADKFARVVMTALQADPKLANADRQSLWNACMKAAADGLLPDGREGALTIYSTKSGNQWIDKVSWMVMIAGLRKKVRNSGDIATWEVETVYEKDEFAYEKGDNPHIKHRPFIDGDPGPARAFYSVARLKTGELTFDVMSRSQVEDVRDKYSKKNRDGQFSPAWVKSFDEMGKKTVARRHSKVLPMSTDLEALLTRDDDQYDLRGNEPQVPVGPKKTLSEKLDLLAQDETPIGHVVFDAATGEITETVASESPTDPQPGEGGSFAPPPPSPPIADAVLAVSASEGSPMPSKVEALEPVAAAVSPSAAAQPEKHSPAHAALQGKGLEMASRGVAILNKWADEDMTPDENALMTPAMWQIWTAEAKDADKRRRQK